MAAPSHELRASPNDDLLRDLDAQPLFTLYMTARRLLHAGTPAAIAGIVVGGAQAATSAATATFYAPDLAGSEPKLIRAGHVGSAWEPPQRIFPHLALRAARGSPGVMAAEPLLGDNAPLGLEAEMVEIGGEHGLQGLLICCWTVDSARPTGWQAALLALAEDTGRALDRLRLRGVNPQPEPVERDASILTMINAVNDIGLLYGNLIDRLLDALLTQVLTALQLGGGALYLYNEPSERLELAVWARGPAAAYGRDPAPVWEGSERGHALAHARETAQAGFPVLTVLAGSSDEAPGSPLAATLREAGAQSLTSVPLLAGGWLTGVLQVTAAPGHRVTESQEQTLRALAHQVAVVIENARLFAQTRADQERARAVVDATNDAILMIDERRRPMIVNRRARFFFGLNERDMIGKSFDQLSNLFSRIFEHGPRFTAWLGQLLRSESERALEEFRVLSPEPRVLQCYSAPVTDLHDRYLGRLLVFRDVTREREVERMKNDFVSTVSHELRTPLTSIQGALQLVLGQPELGRLGMAAALPERGRDLLTISRNNTERLIRLINDILDIAKIEQGRIELRREPIAAAELCRLAVAEISVFANEREILVELQVRRWLPPVLADRDRTVQVLVNLLSNAIKFSAAGQRVVVSARRDGMMVSFAVQDWGRGIAAEQQSRLFQKFQQLDSSTTRDVGGTGLGLAISKALVEEQGGRMWLDSQLGAGSTFNFTLPVAPSAEGAQSGPRVLIAEGSAMVRAELSAALIAEGWEPHAVDDLATLLSGVEAVQPALVLLGQLDAPGEEEVLRRLLESAGGTHPPVLLLSDNPPASLPAGVETLRYRSDPAVIAAHAGRMVANRRAHVLVVDDDPHVRPVLVRLLQRHGLQVSNASDGYQALVAAEAQRPDVILLDIKMPGLDGFEVLRRLKSRPETAAIPVIILTANDLSDSTRAHGLEVGAQAYLEKPIAYERLISTVYTAMGLSEGGQ